MFLWILKINNPSPAKNIKLATFKLFNGFIADKLKAKYLKMLYS